MFTSRHGLTKQLSKEGILVLGHQQADPIIAELLNLPVPVKGEFVSCRIRRRKQVSRNPKVFLAGNCWELGSTDIVEGVPPRETYRTADPSSFREG